MSRSISLAGALTPRLSRLSGPDSLCSPFTFRQRSVTLSSSPRSPPLISFYRIRRSSLLTRPVAASQEESKQKQSEEVDAEEKQGGEGPGEEWKEALESFKERALKMQSVSREAYEMYLKKATVMLQETSERLKIQADKVNGDLSLVMKEISDESNSYLAAAAENSPDIVKEIVETYESSTEEVRSLKQLQDFHIGIPYGAVLSVGGFLHFMLTGSVSGIRFGVILGIALLAFSVSSLRSWKKGGSSPFAIKGQAAIAGILCLRELYLLFQRPSFSTLFITFFSGAVVGTYIYMLSFSKKPNPELGTEH